VDRIPLRLLVALTAIIGLIVVLSLVSSRPLTLGRPWREACGRAAG
jgi:hypothetical protein